MVTTKDFRTIWNGCEHGRARYYPGFGASYSVLYKTQATSSEMKDLVRDAVTFTSRWHQDGEIRQLEVDPWLNFFEGLVTHSESSESETTDAKPKRKSMKQLLLGLLRPVGALRFVFLPLCMTTAGLFRFSGRFDVVYGSGPWAALTAWLLRRLGKARLFLYLDRDYEPGLMPEGFKERWTANLENFLVARADLAVSVSHRLADRREAECGRRPEVMPNGVDWERFASAREQAVSSKRIVYVGHVAWWSGLELIIKSLVPVFGRYPDARLEIIGGGQPGYLAELERVADACGIGDRVEFLGSQPYEKLPELLAGAAVGLANSEPSPYRVYACPLKVMEYMAAGVPVVATTETEAADIVERAGAGRSVDYDLEKTTELFQEMLDNPAALRQHSQCGIEFTRTLQWSDVVAWERDLILEKLGRERRTELPVAEERLGST